MTLEVSSSDTPKLTADDRFIRLKPGPKRSAVDVGKHQRTRLQRAMTELVAEGGYRSVTVRKLTKLARVSTGTFYKHFGGADACFLASHQAVMEQVQRELTAARTPQLDRRDQAARSVRALLDPFLRDPAVGRLALIEAFAAGPAARGRIRMYETRLEMAMLETLDRRGCRTSSVSVAWIVAGALHAARLQSSGQAVVADRVDEIVQWAQRVIGVDECAPHPREVNPAPNPHPVQARVGPARKDGDEAELITAAVMKLARAGGYWRLLGCKAGDAAGVPTTRIKRYFTSLEECYLHGITRIARALFHPPSLEGASPVLWDRAVRDRVASIALALDRDPDKARFALTGMLEPGLEGLTSKQALIAELANSWSAALPATRRPPTLLAEMAQASLWSAADRALTSSPRRTPGASERWASLFLASVG